MSWWQNPENTEQEDVTLQQRAYIESFYLKPHILAHLRLISDSMSTEGMTSSEACIAGRARDSLLAQIRKNAGITDELAIVKAEAEIAMASPIMVQKEENRLEGFNNDGI